MIESLVLLLLIPFLLLSCAAAHAIAIVASRVGTAGPFWATYLRWCVVALGLPAVAGALLPRVGAHWALAQPYVAVCLHLALLLLGLIRVRSLTLEGARGLFGQAGFTRGYGWILAAAIPLVILVMWGAGEAARGHAHPGLLWVVEIAMLGALSGLALSASRSDVRCVAADQPVPVRDLPDWARAMTAAGLSFRTLHTIRAEPTPGGPAVSSPLVTDPPDAVSPRIHAALQKLIHGLEQGVFAPILLRCPRDAGEAEVAIAASRLLAARQQERCLLVAPRDSEALVALLRAAAGRVRAPGPRVPAEQEVAMWTRGQAAPPQASLWVVDADVLAEHLLLDLARDPAMLQSIGCVFWWNCQEYSGIYAANMWAVSRRLDRLIHQGGRRSTPVLVNVRETGGGGDQLSRFLQWLLPFAFDAHTTFSIPATARRDITVHVLGEGQPALFASILPTGTNREVGHPALLCAVASVQAGWPTGVELPAAVNHAEAHNLLASVGIDGSRQLLPGVAAAGVRIHDADAAEVLSFLPAFGEGGRLGAPDRPHHVVLVPPENPYLRALLLSTMPTTRLGRRLLAAEATPQHMRRQLVHALAELPDTYHGLRRTFHWDEVAIRTTLESLRAANRLATEEVRFLDEAGRLVVDRLYRTPDDPAGQGGGLHVARAGIFEVRESAAKDSPVRLSMDPERAPIAAYPGRVFVTGGRRFRVRDEQLHTAATAEGWVACQQEGKVVTTERVRKARVADLRAIEGYQEVRFGLRQELSRQMVDLRYREHVLGRIDRHKDVVSGLLAPQQNTFRKAIEVDFETRGLLLKLPPIQGQHHQVVLASLARALQIVLPVHVAIDADALAVLPVSEEVVRDRGTSEQSPSAGVVVVDLYPGGMGLIDAFRDDDALVMDLLRAIDAWVTGCPCNSDAGCIECIGTTGAMAMQSTVGANRRALTSLLNATLRPPGTGTLPQRQV